MLGTEVTEVRRPSIIMTMLRILSAELERHSIVVKRLMRIKDISQRLILPANIQIIRFG